MPKNVRRVVRLSRVDRERLERGEISTPEEALHNTDAPPVKVDMRSVGSRSVRESSEEKLSAHERDILREVPPHFGKL